MPLVELKPAKSIRQKVYLPVEDYGEDAFVWIEKLSADDLLWLRGRFGGEGSTLNPKFTAHVLRLSMIDEAGNRVYPEPDPALSDDEANAIRDGQAAKLAATGAGEFQRIADAAIKLSRVVATEVPEKNGRNGCS